MMDPCIDLALQEQEVLLYLFHGFLPGRALKYQVVDLPPCIAFCEEEGPITWLWGASCNVWTPKPRIPNIKVLLGGIKLTKLRKGQHAHDKVVPEDLVHTVKLPAT